MLEETRMLQQEAIDAIKQHLEFAEAQFEILPEDDEDVNKAWHHIREAARAMGDV